MRPEYNITESTFPDFFASLQKSNPAVDVSGMLYPGPALPVRPASGLISLEEALDDVRFFFEALEHGYSGYRFFGGKEVFDNARTLIEIELAGYAYPMQSEWLPYFITKRLGFINDGHFSIEDYRLLPESASFLDETCEFIRLGDRYLLKGNYLYGFVKAINDRPPEEFLRMSLSEDGRLVYRLALKSNLEAMSCTADGSGYRCSITFLLRKQPLEVVLARQVPELFPKTAYASTWLAGISTITCRTLMAQTLPDYHLEQFASSGATLRQEPALILDLRGNSGGSDGYAFAFFKNWTGHNVSLPGLIANRSTPSTFRLQENLVAERYSEREGRNYLSWFENPLERIQAEPEWSLDWYGGTETAAGNSNPVAGSGQLFVLTDDGVASAAETTVGLSRMIQGSLVLGLPTAGVHTFGNLGLLRLPHSRATVWLATTWFHIFGSGGEGLGFEPDIWLPGKGMEDRLARFIERYGLDRIRKAVKLADNY